MSNFPLIGVDGFSFETNLFIELCKSCEENENVFVSPISISLALTSLLKPPNQDYVNEIRPTFDATATKQIVKAIGIVEDEFVLDEVVSLGKILNTSAEGLTVSRVDRVFPDETYKVLEKYLAVVKNAFNYQWPQVKAEGSKSEIDKFVEGCIEKKVKSFAEQREGACVLVSSIYFKGDWLHQFKAQNTNNGVFISANKQASIVKMMSQENEYYFRTYPRSKFQCVKIPYKKKSFSMLILLPNDRDFSVDYVIKNLDAKTVESLRCERKFDRKYLSLKIPKFKIKFDKSLTQILQSLGIEHAFNKRSPNLSTDAQLPNNRLFLSKVVQQSSFEMSGESIEAGAATDPAELESKENGPKPRPFTVDHPFAFMIKHKNQILFIGRVNEL